MNEIKDGTGSGTLAKVDPKNRVSIFGVTSEYLTAAIREGAAFSVLTGDIELTTDGESAVFYICNNESSPMVIDSITVGYNSSTGGSGQPKIGTFQQADTGTIIDAAVPCLVVNQRIGSANTINIKTYRGFEGATIVGVGGSATMMQAAPAYETNLPKLVIERGRCSAITITPPAGNTSMIVNIALRVYLLDEV
jgi:hypothetical protein